MVINKEVTKMKRWWKIFQRLFRTTYVDLDTLNQLNEKGIIALF